MNIKELELLQPTREDNPNSISAKVIVKLCAILIEHLPNFWKYSKNILDEKFRFNQVCYKSYFNN